MKELINFVVRHYHWPLFILLEAISLTLLFSKNNYQRSVWISSTNAVVGKVYEIDAYIEHFFNLTIANEELTARNVYLEYRVQKLKEQLEKEIDKQDSTQYIAYDTVQQYKTIPAKVISNSTDKKDNLIMIDKGSSDGIRKDMGVISGCGVVGIVYMVNTHYSIVLPVLSSKSNISCMIENRGYYGYFNWTGGAPNLAYIENIPRHAYFALYDRVVTSGYSAIFPPGIPVGKILHVYNSPDGLSYRLQIQLYTDFTNLRNVLVIDDSAKQERLELLRQAKDSLQVDINKQ